MPEFKFRCPKCHKTDYTLRAERNAYIASGKNDMIFHCRCGTMLFGAQIETEMEKQRVIFDAGYSEAERLEAEARKAAAEREAAAQLILARRREEQAKREAHRLQLQEERRLQLEQDRAAEKERRAQELREAQRQEAVRQETLRLEQEERRVANARAAHERKVFEQPTEESMKPPPGARGSAAVPCNYCGATVWRRPSEVERQKEFFCNPEHTKLFKAKGQTKPAPEPAVFVVEPEPVILEPVVAPEPVLVPEPAAIELAVGKCARPECQKPHTTNSKYCSRTCSNQTARENERAKKAAQAPKPVVVKPPPAPVKQAPQRLTVPCEVCQKPVMRKPSEIKNNKHHFCSPEHANEARRTAAKKLKAAVIIPPATRGFPSAPPKRVIDPVVEAKKRAATRLGISTKRLTQIIAVWGEEQSKING